MDPLTDTEKAYFDTIKQVAGGARPKDLRLLRMELDDTEVAVVCQVLLDSNTAAQRGLMPLAILITDEQTERLVGPEGTTAERVNPTDVEGPG